MPNHFPTARSSSSSGFSGSAISTSSFSTFSSSLSSSLSSSSFSSSSFSGSFSSFSSSSWSPQTHHCTFALCLSGLVHACSMNWFCSNYISVKRGSSKRTTHYSGKRSLKTVKEHLKKTDQNTMQIASSESSF